MQDTQRPTSKDIVSVLTSYTEKRDQDEEAEEKTMPKLSPSFLPSCHFISKFKPLPTHLIIISLLTKFKHNITSLCYFLHQREDDDFAVYQMKRRHNSKATAFCRSSLLSKESWFQHKTTENLDQNRNATEKDEWSLTLKLSWSSSSWFFWILQYPNMLRLLCCASNENDSRFLCKYFHCKINWYSLKFHEINVSGMVAIWLIFIFILYSLFFI